MRHPVRYHPETARRRILPTLILLAGSVRAAVPGGESTGAPAPGLEARGALQWQRQQLLGPDLHQLYYLPDTPGNRFQQGLPDRSRLRFDGRGGDVYALTAAELHGLLQADPDLRPSSVERCQPALDLARIATGAQEVQMGIDSSGEGLGLDGSGVAVGLVDTGIDVFHPDFMDAQGNTRILALWDQVEGIVYTQAQIQAGSVPNRDDDGHGTHVAGIAAGAGRAEPVGQFSGFAPEAGLLVVRTTFLESDVLAGVQWVYQQAESRGMPAVVNLSLESHIGPHDGTSWFEQELSALTGPGRLLVVAAGNNAENGIHTEAGYGQSITLPFDPDAFSTSQLACYAASTDRPVLVLEAPDGTTFSPGGTRVHQGTTIIFPAAGHRGSDWECLLELRTGQDPGRWVLHLSHAAAGSRSVQAWGRALEFTQPESAHTLGMPSTADSALCVGSYVTRWQWDSLLGGRQYGGTSREGQPSLFSAWGPRVDGQQRPHLLMPGQGIFAPLSSEANASGDRIHPGGNHWLLQGTSMAAPALAGSLALLLSALPDLGLAEVQELLAGVGHEYTAQAGRGLLWLPELMEAALGGFSNLDLQPGLDELTVDWRLNTTVDGGVQTLQRVRDTGSTTLDSLAAVAGSYSFVDTGLVAGETVRYRVQLFDAGGGLQATLLSAPGSLLAAVPGLLAGAPHPNPAWRTLELPLQVENPLELEWSVFALNGRRVLQGRNTVPRGLWPLALDVSGLASGRYVLDLAGGGRREQHTITVVH